jgi:hypothetical protein
MNHGGAETQRNFLCAPRSLDLRSSFWRSEASPVSSRSERQPPEVVPVRPLELVLP